MITFLDIQRKVENSHKTKTKYSACNNLHNLRF